VINHATVECSLTVLIVKWRGRERDDSDIGLLSVAEAQATATAILLLLLLYCGVDGPLIQITQRQP